MLSIEKLRVAIAQSTNSLFEEESRILNEKLEKFVDDLVETFHLEREEVVNCLSKNFEEISTSDPLTFRPKARITKRSIAKIMSSSENTCCKMIRGKNELCGKKATNEVDGKYYCGRYKDDGSATGHLKSVLAEIEKKKNQREKPTVVNVPLPVKRSFPKKKGTLKENAEKSLDKSSRLIRKTCVPGDLELIRVGDKVIDKNTRILFDGKSAYGRLGEDDETILQFEDADIRFLDSRGIEQCPIPMHGIDDPQNENSDEEEVVYL